MYSEIEVVKMICNTINNITSQLGETRFKVNEELNIVEVYNSENIIGTRTFSEILEESQKD